MESTTFNPTQIHLLRMFQYAKTGKELDELKSVLYKFYTEKMNSSLNELWKSGRLDQDKLDEINSMDLHKLN